MMAAYGAEIEAAAWELAGRRLDGVRYYTAPHGTTDKPAWDEDVAHVADYGIDLVTPDGITGITWELYGEFGYGLKLGNGPLLNELARAEFCSVAAQPPWAAVLGKRITEARVHWLDMTWGGRETTGPAALTLRFDGSTGIMVVCGSWRGPQEPVLPTGDDIVVLWQPEALSALAPYLPGGLLRPLNRAGAQVGRACGPTRDAARPRSGTREGSRGTTLQPARPDHTPATGSSGKPLPDLGHEPTTLESSSAP